MTDFTKIYAADILRKIIQKIVRDRNKLENVQQKERKLKETAADVRSQRHWQSVAHSQLLFNEIETGFQQLYDLDQQTNWRSNLELKQDRFRFVIEKYDHILKEYDSRFSNKY
ncbi:hypothetical protein IGK74_002429 [Enterococcus sp. AZ150]|uniref:DUF1140 family protein n=1 Tax=Enterococcus sp. AZ150 TaxID=2774866 RepID=UPI003F22793E